MRIVVVWLSLWMLLLLFPATPGLAGAWTFDPASIPPGGVALLSWNGDPSVQIEIVFQGEKISPVAGPVGSAVLLGVDLEAAEGVLPIRATVRDRQGRTTHYGLFLQVEKPPTTARKSERLRLAPKFVVPQQPEDLERIRRERAELQAVYAIRSIPDGWQVFRRPLMTPVSSSFGRSRIMNGTTTSRHAGVDFSGTAGLPIEAAAAGTVVFAGDLYFTGLTVIIDHGGGLFTLYAHMQKLLCAAGELLAAGAVVGEVGSSGRATGPHLHWGAKLRGARIDPLALVRLTGGEKR